MGGTLISRRPWNIWCLQVSSVATYHALKIKICKHFLDCVSLKSSDFIALLQYHWSTNTFDHRSRWETTVQVSCKVTVWFKEQMACFLKKNLPKKLCHFCRRNVRLRKQYLSFLETASMVAVIFIMRWTWYHCELSAAVQVRIFKIHSLFHTYHECHYKNSLLLNLLLIWVCLQPLNLINLYQSFKLQVLK